MFCESPHSLGQNGNTKLCQFLKMQYYWKGLKESGQKFDRHCLQCQTSNLQTPNYVQPHPQTAMDLISMGLIGPFKSIIKGNQYALNVICMLINYITGISHTG